MSVTRGQCDARPTVTFPAARHHRHWLVPNYTATSHNYAVTHICYTNSDTSLLIDATFSAFELLTRGTVCRRNHGLFWIRQIKQISLQYVLVEFCMNTAL